MRQYDLRWQVVHSHKEILFFKNTEWNFVLFVHDFHVVQNTGENFIIAWRTAILVHRSVNRTLTYGRKRIIADALF